MRAPLKSPTLLRPFAVVPLAALALAVAGCTDESPGTGPTPGVTTGSPSSASPGAAGPVASCVVGDWRSTAASGTAAAGGASATIGGGSGVRFTVGSEGVTTVDFAGMQPATFTVTAGGGQAEGSFQYAGTVSGTIRTGGGVTATSGTWEPVGAVNWEQTRLTVDLTKPVRARPLDGVRIGDYTGPGADQTGNVVDVDPFLGAGTYECRGDTLVLAPGERGGITWTLRRESPATSTPTAPSTMTPPAVTRSAP